MGIIKQAETRLETLNRTNQRTSDELKEDYVIFKEKFELSQLLEVENQINLRNYVAGTPLSEFNVSECNKKKEMVEFWKTQKEQSSKELDNIMEELHYRAIFHASHKH